MKSTLRTPVERGLVPPGRPDLLEMNLLGFPVAKRPAPMSDEQARRNRAAAEADEVFSEGRKHRNIRIQRHE